jgi:hypothetical protein
MMKEKGYVLTSRLLEERESHRKANMSQGKLGKEHLYAPIVKQARDTYPEI